MLTPGQPHVHIVLAVALALLLAGLTLRAVRKDRREYGRFKRYRSTVRRQATFRKWLIESFLVFGGASVVILALTWQFIPLMLADVETWAATRWWRDLMLAGGMTASVIVWAAGAAIAIGAVGAIWLARASDEVPAIGDISAILPRNRQELRWGAALSINAGVVEELMFRLALPTLIFGITGSALIAVGASIVIFGALHLYQGVAGVIGSMLIGLVLMVLYLASGSIVLAIAVHAAIDLRSLVLIPMVVFGVHRKPGRRTSAVPPSPVLPS
ncbi:CPBP family intramembrane glutamic endopeptidase [Salinibacterium hongtaonis]|uniref:CPBP family intramembrane metalloprotease domain-containing protein n=1 Tax=Homoserinimonas hongtaonis TaxID=2079791 RepID=A0A2U1T047_9MICO|nr:type II CAAX endopeptidase family protein [Salinibacterium hongtaonis]PWB97251.1 CPBP family intramembrane metalloprotease domain-containing protein [Salinibacterium hongtaonis]